MPGAWRIGHRERQIRSRRVGARTDQAQMLWAITQARCGAEAGGETRSDSLGDHRVYRGIFGPNKLMLETRATRLGDPRWVRLEVPIQTIVCATRVQCASEARHKGINSVGSGGHVRQRRAEHKRACGVQANAGDAHNLCACSTPPECPVVRCSRAAAFERDGCATTVRPGVSLRSGRNALRCFRAELGAQARVPPRLAVRCIHVVEEC